MFDPGYAWPEVSGKNLFDIDPHDIHKAKVQMTMMDGVIRHQDGL